MNTQLQDAMAILIGVFHSYSGREGDKYKLNTRELKTLLQEEFEELVPKKDPQFLEKIMRDLDANKDGEVDFQEFVVLVTELTVAYNEFFIELDKSCKEDEEKHPAP